MAEELTCEQAEGELRALISAVIFDACRAQEFTAEAISEEIVETLVLDRQDIIAALHEQPQRWWFMADSERGPWLFRGGDEFSNPTIAVWAGRRRGYFVFSYRPRLRKVLDRG